MYSTAETYSEYNDDILLRSLKNRLYNNEKEEKQLKDLFKKVKNAFLPEGIEINDVNIELYELYQEFKKLGGKSKKDFIVFLKDRKQLKNVKLKKPRIKNKIKLFLRRRKLFSKIANSLRVIKIKYFQKTRSFDDELFIMKMRFGVKTANKVKEELEKLGVTDLKEQVDFNILKISTNKVFCKDEELLNFINKEKERKGFLETVKECVNNIVDNIIGVKSEAKEFNTFLESIDQKFEIGNKIKISREKDVIAISRLMENGERTRKGEGLENNSIQETTQENSIICKLRKGMTLSNSTDLEIKTPEKTAKREIAVETSVAESVKANFKSLEKAAVNEIQNDLQIETKKEQSISKLNNVEVNKNNTIEKTIEKILNKKKEMETSKTMEQQKETTKEQFMNKLDNKQEAKLNETQLKTEPAKTNEAKPIVGENTRRLAERRKNLNGKDIKKISSIRTI